MSTSDAPTDRPSRRGRRVSPGGSYGGGAPYGNGHINDTFCRVVRTGRRHHRYILQRINEHVFRNVEAVMEMSRG